MYKEKVLMIVKEVLREAGYPEFIAIAENVIDNYITEDMAKRILKRVKEII